MSLHHNINRHVLQVWLWLLGLLLVLLLVAGLALQFPYWQRFAARQVTGYLADKLNTRVRIGSFSTDWRNHFVLEDFYLEDQHQDTLLFAQSLGLDLDLGALLRNQISIRHVTLERALLQVKATLPDSAYNFDFIRAAFSAPAAGKADGTVFTYKFGNLRLDQLRVHIRDSVQGHYVRARIGRFRAEKNRFRPHAAALHYELLSLEHSTIAYRQTGIAAKPADTLSPAFSFRELRLRDLRLDYAHAAAGRQWQAAIGTARVLADTFNLKQQRIGLARLQLSNSSFSWYQQKSPAADTLVIHQAATRAPTFRAPAPDTRGRPGGWSVKARKLVLRNLRLAFGNDRAPLGPQALDLNHLQLDHLNLDLELLQYQHQQASARLQHLSFREKSGFGVKRLTGELQTRPRQVLVRHARLQTTNSRVSGIRQLAYGWAQKRPGRPAAFLFSASLGPSVLSPKDLAYLAPYLPAASPLPAIYRHNFHLQGSFAVSEHSIRAGRLKLRGLSGTQLDCSGEVTGLTSDRDTRVNLQVHQLLTNRQDARQLLPPDALAPGLTLPERLQLSGHFAGGAAALVLQPARIKTSDGAFLETRGTIRNLTSPKNKWLDLQVKHYSTSRDALLHLLPPNTVSPDLQLPDQMVFSGTFQGASLERFRSRTTIRSSLGLASLDLVVHPGERFSGWVQVWDFDLGKFLTEEQVLGRATARASFNGQGLSFATTRVHFDVSIRHISYNRASYRNIHLNGTLDQEEYDVQGSLAKVAAQRLGNKLKKLNPTKIKLLLIRKRSRAEKQAN